MQIDGLQMRKISKKQMKRCTENLVALQSLLEWKYQCKYNNFLIQVLFSIGKMMKCSAWTNCIWGTIVHLILIVLFAIYAFDNPDPEECWVTSIDDFVLPEEPVNSAAEYYNYGSLLRIYFGLGFFYYAFDMVKNMLH